MEPETEKKSNGALIGSIIIVVILVIGGIYVWQSKVKTTLEQKQQITPADTEELNTLEQDLNSVDTNVDVDINNIN